MSYDLAMIPKYSVTSPALDEIDQIRDIQTYWNRIVSKSFFWVNIAKEELDKQSFKKIHKHLKAKLISECSDAIKETEKSKVSSHEAIKLKQDLLEEYEDRLLYLKINF